MIWVIRILVSFACLIMYGICAAFLFASLVHSEWWAAALTAPWWGFGFLVASMLLHDVWTQSL